MNTPSRPTSIPSLHALGLAGLTLLLVAPACGDDDPAVDAAPQLWYQTCGDPVCSTYEPTPGDTLCTAEQVAGDACGNPGERCEIPDDPCNADLVCTDQDPATNCPISVAAKKRDIHYLDAAERAAIAARLEAVELATYRYRDQGERGPRMLGFIIDDMPAGSHAVLPHGQRVDLYGYTSMAVAALQAQAQEIDRLNARLEALEADVRALRQDARTR